MRWIDPHTLDVDGVRFLVSHEPERLKSSEASEPAEPGEPSFILLKDQTGLSHFQELTATTSIKRILEVGIFQGGSAVLYHKLFQPEKLVAVEYAPEPIESLGAYIAASQLGDVVKPYYGVDQADQATMAELLEREFAERNIDLVVDDASHQYEKTKACFNVVFPFIRPGELYIIEDWSWAQSRAQIFQNPGGVWYDQPALTNLVFEIVMLAGSWYELVSEIVIRRNLCCVRRGPGPLPPGEFDISTAYLTRGRPFVPAL
jgi:predicted O-methyltransferase YrrM